MFVRVCVCAHVCVFQSIIPPPSPAVKNQASGQFFLNAEGDLPESRAVIEKGVEWEYVNNDHDKETLQTNGPLRHGVLIMVRTHRNTHTNTDKCNTYCCLLVSRCSPMEMPR